MIEHPLSLDVAVSFDNLNTRVEKHNIGDDDVEYIPAVDLAFSFPLMELKPEPLVDWLKVFSIGDHSVKRLTEVATYYVNEVSVPSIEWNQTEWDELTVYIDRDELEGLNEDHLVTLRDCKVNKPKIVFNRGDEKKRPMVSLRIQHAGEHAIGELEKLQGQTVRLQIGAQGELDVSHAAD